jgi:hypothetical protein
MVKFDLEDGGKPYLDSSTQEPWDAAAFAVEQMVLWLAAEAKQSAVACEKYQINAKTAQRGQAGAEHALGMNGVVRYHCLWRDVVYADEQQASAAKSSVSDPILRQLGLYERGYKHVNDATRHAVLYALKKHWIDATLLVPR